MSIQAKFRDRMKKEKAMLESFMEYLRYSKDLGSITDDTSVGELLHILNNQKLDRDIYGRTSKVDLPADFITK